MGTAAQQRGRAALPSGVRLTVWTASFSPARAPAPQLPAVLRRPERLAGRHLDHARRDELARLPADRLGAAARRRRLLRPDPDALPAPLAGVFVDRWDRHRVLVVTQVLSMLQSRRWRCWRSPASSPSRTVLVAQVVQGVINAFDMPARQAFVVEMVEDRADLPNAIALNSSMVNGSRMIGPSIGGVLIAAVGEGWCFLIDAISLPRGDRVALAMRVRRAAARPSDDARRWRSCARASRYVVGFAPIRTALLLLALVSMMGMPYTVLMPAIAARGAARRPAHARLADGRRRASARWPARSTSPRGGPSSGLGRVIVVAALRVRRGAGRVRAVPEPLALARRAAARRAPGSWCTLAATNTRPADDRARSDCAGG